MIEHSFEMLAGSYKQISCTITADNPDFTLEDCEINAVFLQKGKEIFRKKTEDFVVDLPLTFTFELKEIDTIELDGEYPYQVNVKDFLGNVAEAMSGIMTIRKTYLKTYL